MSSFFPVDRKSAKAPRPAGDGTESFLVNREGFDRTELNNVTLNGNVFLGVCVSLIPLANSCSNNVRVTSVHDCLLGF